MATVVLCPNSMRRVRFTSSLGPSPGAMVPTDMTDGIGHDTSTSYPMSSPSSYSDLTLSARNGPSLIMSFRCMTPHAQKNRRG